MTLQIIVSPNGSLASEYVMNEIVDKMQEDPLGPPIYYIVPEQMTFQQEYSLFQQKNIKGSMRTHVVSFSRLAWRVLQETGGSTRKFITSTGTQMLLQKIISEREEPLHVFEKAADKIGFLQQLDELITEFKRHEITPGHLKEQLQYTTENKTLSLKLTDLHYIYNELTKHLSDQYIDGEDQLQLLIDKIKSTSYFQDAHIYIDGFYRFTPQEFSIITELMKKVTNITVALTSEQMPSTEKRDLDELDLFYQTKETYYNLQDAAKEQNIEQKDLVFLSSDQKDHAVFNHLRKNFNERPTPPYEGKTDNHLQVAEAVHPRAEVEGVIQEILRLVRKGEARYRDIALFVRDTEQYNDLIQTLFSDYNIPVFIDAKRTMLNHPLIEFLRSLFEVVQSNWRYDALFRLLKTQFILPNHAEYPLTEDAIDQLENYVLEFGIRNKSQWLQEEPWIFGRFRGFEEAVQTDADQEKEKRINVYRQQVVDALQPFDEQIRQAKTVRERCELIFALLEQLHIPTQLERRRREWEETGAVEKAREEEQAWQAFLHLLDELVEMIGEEPFSLVTFFDIFNAGLESLEFSHVPPTMDHIIVGSIDHSRVYNKKCVFLIGVNEGSWPMKPNVDGMINENEREYLEQFGLTLAASNERVLLDDYFYMYVAFTLPKNYLWVSYTISDHEGHTKIPSQMILRLKQLFPTIKDPKLLTDPDELKQASRFITTAEKTRGPLTVQLARYLQGYPIEPIWWEVLNWYVEHEEKYSPTYKTLQSIFYENKPTNLRKDTVDQLVSKDIYASVSRMEMYHRCSYQHFLQYHLNLDERRTYSLEAPDIGQLFHEALKNITEAIQQEGKDFSDLNKEDAEQYAKQSLQQLAPILQHHVLSSSNRYRYILRKLQQVIAQATFILGEQARVSGFSPVGIELQFGYKEGLKPIRIPLSEGRELVLRGRIDRVDQAILEDQLFLRIIDYKSSSQRLSLEDVYYGLALQMLTYLHVVLLHAADWLGMKASPAGILYFHIHDAMVQNAAAMDEKRIEQEIFKQYKMNGLLINDVSVVRLMDETLSSGYSQIVPVAVKRDGDFYKDAHVTDGKTFDLLQSHILSLMKEAGLQIISGDVKLNPFETTDGRACRFCPFRSICQFDPILQENNYRRLTPLTDKEVKKYLQKQLD